MFPIFRLMFLNAEWHQEILECFSKPLDQGIIKFLLKKKPIPSMICYQAFSYAYWKQRDFPWINLWWWGVRPLILIEPLGWIKVMSKSLLAFLDDWKYRHFLLLCTACYLISFKINGNGRKIEGELTSLRFWDNFSFCAISGSNLKDKHIIVIVRNLFSLYYKG